VIVRAGIQRDLAIVTCAISAGIHAALVPGHFAESTGAASGFFIAAVVLIGLAVALTRRAGPLELRLAAVTFAGLIGSYALAATSGLPVLHPDPEPVDGLAVATKVIEGAGLLAVARLLWRGRPAVAALRPQPKGTTT
jgi:hypothetical protein